MRHLRLRRCAGRVRLLAGVAGLALLGGCGSGGGFSTTAYDFCGSDADLRGMLATDLNNDGADDVAVGCRTRHDPLTGSVEIWLSDGDGHLSKHQTRTLGTQSTGGEGASPITAADFNEDGNPDLVISDPAGIKHGVSLLYGHGDGSFSEPRYFSRPITWAATSDVNGDGHADLIPVLYGGGGRHYIAGDGGRLDASGPVRLLARDTRDYQEPAQIDLNADGRTDAVIPVPHHGRLEVYPSGGKHYSEVLGKAVRKVQRINSGALRDGDDRPDLLVFAYREGDGHATRWVLTDGGIRLSDPIQAVPADAANVQAADFNGDNVPDLLVRVGYKPKPKYHGAAHPLVLIGKPGGGYASPQTLDLPGSPGGWALGDFNADGKTDMVYRRMTDDTDQGVVFLSHW